MKHGLFGLDMLLTNGHLIWYELAPASKTLAQREREYTKVKFCQSYTKTILQRAPSLRKRFLAGMIMTKAGRDVELLSPPSDGHAQQRKVEHELIDMGKVQSKRRAAETPRRGRGRVPAREKKKHGGPSGECAYPECTIAKPKRPQTRCMQCTNRKGMQGAYYHLECFFATHKSYPR